MAKERSNKQVLRVSKQPK
jgi:hypothetical protein